MYLQWSSWRKRQGFPELIQLNSLMVQAVGSLCMSNLLNLDLKDGNCKYHPYHSYMEKKVVRMILWLSLILMIPCFRKEGRMIKFKVVKKKSAS